MSNEPKSAIITGAASGFGRATAIELARHGWRVALTDLDVEGAQETLQMVRAAGGQGCVEFLDVTKPQLWEELRDLLQSHWPNLDLLVNNAGVGAVGNLGEWSLDDWHWIQDVNLNGAVYGCHTMFDWLKENPQGAHIVNVASLAAIASPPGMAPYNAAKAGLLSFSETLYNELKPHRIGVSCICPAFVNTNMVQNSHYSTEEHRQVTERLSSLSTTTAEEVARQIWRAVERKRLYVFVPTVAKIIWRLKRLAPVTLLNIVSRDRQKHGRAIQRERYNDPVVRA